MENQQKNELPDYLVISIENKSLKPVQVRLFDDTFKNENIEIKSTFEGFTYDDHIRQFLEQRKLITQATLSVQQGAISIIPFAWKLINKKDQSYSLYYNDRDPHQMQNNIIKLTSNFLLTPDTIIEFILPPATKINMYFGQETQQGLKKQISVEGKNGKKTGFLILNKSKFELTCVMENKVSRLKPLPFFTFRLFVPGELNMESTKKFHIDEFKTQYKMWSDSLESVLTYLANTEEKTDLAKIKTLAGELGFESNGQVF